MRITRYINKYLSALILCVSFIILLLNFNFFFPDLNRGALALIGESNESPNNIPANINFLSDDKKAFCDYCKNIYGDNLPLSVDNDTFVYYGSVDGYRFYRLQAHNIPFESAHQSEMIGIYIFDSDYLYRPFKTGLYIIGDNDVYTLREAYDKNLIDISEVHKLYIEKEFSKEYLLMNSSVS